MSTISTQAPPGRVTRVVAVFAMLLAMVGAGVASATSALAATLGGMPTYGKPWDPADNQTFWGNYAMVMADGSTWLGYCADNSLRGPASSAGVPRAFGDPHQVTSWVSDLGITASPASLHQLAYIQSRYGNTTDNTQAAAVAQSTWTLLASGHGSYGAYDIRVPGNQADVRAPADVKAAALAMLADAASHAGPYTVTWNVNPPAGPASPTTAVTATATVTSATGAGVPGVPMTFTFNGTPYTATTDANGAASVTQSGFNPGNLVVDAYTNDLPAEWPTAVSPTDSTVQRVIMSGGKSAWSDPTNFVFAIGSTVTTQTSSVIVAAGDSITDTVIVKSAPNATFSGTSTLYGPLATAPVQSATVPAGTPVIGTATFTGTTDANGDASVKTTALTVGDTGFYVWVETANITHADGSTEGPLTGPFGANTETSLNYSPAISTKASASQVLRDTEISDTTILTGIQTSVGGHAIVNTVSGSLYGPLPAVKAADGTLTCAGLDWFSSPPVALAIAPFAVTANGEIPGVGKFKVSGLGCYTYAEKLTWTVEGTTHTGTVEHKPGIPAQTILVTQPEAITQTSAQVAHPGDSLTDKVTITGTLGNGGEFKATLYGPLAPETNKDCSTITTAMWDAALADGTLKAAGPVETIAFTGDGDFTTAGVTVPTAGCYTWHEAFSFTNSPSSNMTTPLGVVSETTLVIAPTVTTTASAPKGAQARQEIIDTIVVAGTNGKAGVISGYLTGPAAPAKDASGANTCAGLTAEAWATTPKIPYENIAITGDGTYVTKGIKVPSDGCWTFVESLEMADTGKTVHNSKPGAVAETMLFLPSSGGAINAGFVTENPANTAGIILGLLFIAAGGVGFARRKKA